MSPHPNRPGLALIAPPPSPLPRLSSPHPRLLWLAPPLPSVAPHPPGNHGSCALVVGVAQLCSSPREAPGCHRYPRRHPLRWARAAQLRAERNRGPCPCSLALTVTQIHSSHREALLHCKLIGEDFPSARASCGGVRPWHVGARTGSEVQLHYRHPRPPAPERSFEQPACHGATRVQGRRPRRHRLGHWGPRCHAARCRRRQGE